MSGGGDENICLWYYFDEDPVFSKRESGLIQEYLKKHGCTPGEGEDELDDLFQVQRFLAVIRTCEVAVCIGILYQDYRKYAR